MSWEPFGRLLGGSCGPNAANEGTLGCPGRLLGVSWAFLWGLWAALAFPGGSLGGPLESLGSFSGCPGWHFGCPGALRNQNAFKIEPNTLKLILAATFLKDVLLSGRGCFARQGRCFRGFEVDLDTAHVKIHLALVDLDMGGVSPGGS